MRKSPQYQIESLHESLKRTFGAEIPIETATQFFAQMTGQSGDFPSFVRKPEILDPVFGFPATHVTSAATDRSGEDELPLLLAHILAALKSSFYAVEARAFRWQSPARVRDDAERPYILVKRGVTVFGEWDIDGLQCSTNLPIAMSDILPETLVVDYVNDPDAARRIEEHVRSRPGQSGVIATAPSHGWKITNRTAENCDTCRVIHVVVSQTCTNSQTPEKVIKHLEAIVHQTVNDMILVWFTEDDCSTGSPKDPFARKQVIFHSDGDRPGERSLIDGLGWVSPERVSFFRPIMEAVSRLELPSIRLPHHQGQSLFVTDRLTPYMAGMRDRIAHDVLEQLRALGLHE